MATVDSAVTVAPAQVVRPHRARRAPTLAGYCCPDCGADHPLNGRMECATCRRIHDEAAGHSSDVVAEMSDRRGHVVDPEVARRDPVLAHELRGYVDSQARAAYEWAAVEMVARRRRFLAGRVALAEVAA